MSVGKFPDVEICNFQLCMQGRVIHVELGSDAEMSRSGNSHVFRHAAGSPLESLVGTVQVSVM